MGTIRKKYIILLILLFFFPGVASALDLAWDWNGNQEIDGYKIYKRDIDGEYDFNSDPEWTGVTKTATVDTPLTNTCYVVRAYSGEDLSNSSNEVCYTVGSETRNRPILLTTLLKK